jgi:hypothetical protein
MRRWLLPLSLALVVSTVSACAFIFSQDPGGDDCAVRPVSALRHLFGPASVRATTCALIVIVDGQEYSGGVEGGWLDEGAVRIEEFGLVTAANVPIAKPTAYRLDGINPKRMLVLKGGEGSRDEYLVLWGPVRARPDDVCKYAHPTDSQGPRECRARAISNPRPA